MWSEAIAKLQEAGVDAEDFTRGVTLGGSPPQLLGRYGLTTLQVLEVLSDPVMRRFVDQAQALLRYHVMARLYRSALESEDTAAATRLLAAWTVQSDPVALSDRVAGERGDGEWLREQLGSLFAAEQSASVSNRGE